MLIIYRKENQFIMLDKDKMLITEIDVENDLCVFEYNNEIYELRAGKNIVINGSRIFLLDIEAGIGNYKDVANFGFKSPYQIVRGEVYDPNFNEERNW